MSREKYLYISTPEGNFMYYVHMAVDRAFRNLFNQTRRGGMEPKVYKQLFRAWEDILDDYIMFINQLPDHYMTPYIEKTLDKKTAICRKLIVKDGYRQSVQMRSGLSEKLFKAAKSTELIFKILGEYVQTSDITVDRFSQGSLAFLEWRDKLQENVIKLETLRDQLAVKKRNKRRRKVT